MIVVPNFPDMLESELVSVNPNEAPDREDQDPEHVEAEHLRSHQLVSRDPTANVLGRTVFVGILKCFWTSQNRLCRK